MTDATSCTFFSHRAVTGLPDSLTCGDGTVSDVVPLPANTGRMAVRYTFALAVTGTRTVRAKGVGVKVVTIPPPSPPLTGVTAVTSNGDGYCAVVGSGGVDCWGYGTLGQLGNGTTYRGHKGGSDIPVAVVDAG